MLYHNCVNKNFILQNVNFFRIYQQVKKQNNHNFFKIL